MSDKKVVVKVDNLTKSFKIPIEASSGIKQKIINVIKGSKGYRNFKSLQNVSFEVNEGDFFGIVGRNGSGKSTLLKTIAGIYVPNKGGVTVNGKLIPFIELGVGFNPELSGRDNVFLNGALLGFSRKEMEAMYDEIVDFAELGDFMEERLKNYSSGMQVRLAFSIAIKAQGDILILDEVLAVGDEAFQKKCYEYFAQLKRENKTVILVTHDMSSVQRFCNKAMLIDVGKLKKIGKTGEITSLYEKINLEIATNTNKVDKIINNSDFDIKVKTTKVDGKVTNRFANDDKIVFHININPKKDIKDAFVGITIQKPDGEYVFWATTENDSHKIEKFKRNSPIEMMLVMQNVFGENSYSVNISIKSNDRTKEYVIYENAVSFVVVSKGKNGWMLHPNYKIIINEEPDKNEKAH